VTDNADRLGREEPLATVDHARDEIGRLASELDQAAHVLDRRAAELLHSRNRAVAATRAKDEFLSRMSHELRTPLTAVIGFGQLLQLEELSTDNRDSVDHIVRAGRHLLDLINEVLDIARIETGDLSLSVEPIELVGVVEETLSLMGPFAVERDVHLTVDPGAERLLVRADRQRLKQVLLNLFSNAIKYNKVGGRVDVSWTARHDQVRIEVRDTGLGISAGGQARVFVPFDRADAAHSAVEGTGVGLSLSKGLVEAMGGTMGFESVEGAGSTFWVDLPVGVAPTLGPAAPAPVAPTAPGAQPGAPEQPRLSAGGNGSDVVVLYVEDNLANVRVMERLFQGRQERLEVAMQGSLCLDLARQLLPAVILLDLHLPDLDGEDVLMRLKGDPATRDIPVIILSADPTPRRVERLRELGASDYLSKPLDLPVLLAALEAAEPARPV
jgi:signal transduction histidine kinase/ActR/RegA family two-component response regulator